MGYLERNSETWKTPGFSGFECRVSGIGRFQFSSSGQVQVAKKKVGSGRVAGTRQGLPTRHFLL